MQTTKPTSPKLSPDLATRLLRQYGPDRGASVLDGAEAVMNTVASLPQDLQRPVLEFLFDAFDQAHQLTAPKRTQPDRSPAANRTEILCRSFWRLWPFRRTSRIS
jgi:hypothetical protein